MNGSRPRPLFLVPALLAAVAATVLALVVPAWASTPAVGGGEAGTANAGTARAGTAPYCGITWGSLDKSGSLSRGGGTLVDVRAGEHPCYDRLVVDIAGTDSFAGWSARYVPQVLQDPSGRPVPLRGGAFLQVSLQSPDHTPDGTPTYRPVNRSELVDVTGFRTFRQVAWAGEFENVSSLGLGVRARLPFRVFTLPGVAGSATGTRVVIDVAHRW